MALFNKLFPRVKSVKDNNRHEEHNVSEKLCDFNSEQVRMVLFRECDFRGRKLLFDSDATQKVLVEKTNQNEKFIEITNGFGYLIVKSNSDYGQLSEMIFGSVAMSFRGTYFKIHSLSEPFRLMFTQVFPSPHPVRRKVSVSSQPACLSHSFEHSIKLDDSGASSTYSSEQLSDRSTASDTVLVCKRLHSSPLELSKNSLAVDSGCNDYSFSSFSSVPIGFSTWESAFPYKGDPPLSFSSSNLLRRLLRSSSRSLVGSTCSLPNSAEEVLRRNHHRSSKLGFAIVIEIPKEVQEFLTQFFMEHIALLEAMIWRTRHVIEIAYHNPSTFMSVMIDLTTSAASWLINLLDGPKIVKNFWHCLSVNCDSHFSISAFTKESDKVINRTKSYSVVRSDCDSGNIRLSSSFNGKPDIFGFNFGRFLRTGSDRNGGSVSENCGDLIVEQFLKEFCEILETLDVKNTNFFISTLLTAILTHHLGWVATCLPPTATDSDVESSLGQPYNALWGQLADLYGAAGNPAKTAQTVITGSDKTIISKILNCLTYFIRFGNVERKILQRDGVERENKKAEVICKEYDCIPLEYYKRYEDHLKEILPQCKEQMDKGLVKTKTFSNLLNLAEANTLRKADPEPVFKNQNMFTIGDESLENFDSNRNLRDNDNVIFVLGDNERLVGLKKESDRIVKRPTSLRLSKENYQFPKHQAQPDPFRNDYCLRTKLSTSCESLCPVASRKEESRCQSEPPEERKTAKPNFKYTKVKFNLQQYPQVVRNYMKSKNLELEGLPLGEKALDKLSTVESHVKLDFSGYESDPEEVEALQTPSNASELEGANELCSTSKQATIKERRHSKTSKTDSDVTSRSMKLISIPMPKTVCNGTPQYPIEYASTVMKEMVKDYVPDMVLQGTTQPEKHWSSKLKSNLAMNTQHSLLDHPVEEALAIVANTDTWEVQVISSHTYVIDKGSTGVRTGMSQLVANMLESLLQMWKLHIPARYCVQHIEQKLQELCVLSKALAQLLLANEFCTMELLTSALRLEANDVPLLMAVASTHTPQVTQKYGLSFQ